MEKETVILNLRVSIDFTQDALNWMIELSKNSKNKDNDPWFIRDRGTSFLSEFKSLWAQILKEETDYEIQHYFIELGYRENILPSTKIIEAYSGSWIMEAAVTMGTTIGGTYGLIKAISDIPKIAEGLTKLKDSIAKKFHFKTNEEAVKLLSEQSNQKQLSPPPFNILQTKDFVIDARPLLAIKPGQMKSHSLHLQAAVSENTFTLENLGKSILKDIQIGLFVGKSKRDQWKFSDAFISNLTILSPKQTTTKQIAEFKHLNNSLLITSLPVHVDCWVQDAFGIYIFNFYLD